MNEMYFKNILIADFKTKSARSQNFAKGFNVVTSQDNHVGKSSLLKSLYYTLGAEVEYDQIWDKNTKLYVVTIDINQKEYKVARLQTSFAVFCEDKLILLTRSVGRDLAKMFEQIFSFAVYLPNKETKKIEMAPPVFTFMPYFIDQDEGWSGLYNSFARINQYRKDARIKSLYYHLNIYTRETVELMAKKDLLKDEIEKLKKDEEKIRITYNTLLVEVENLLPADSIEVLDQNMQIPKEQIAILVNRIGEVRNKIQVFETMLRQHEYQLEVIQDHKKRTLDVNKKDDIQSCPKCGYTFDEELYSVVRANYNIRNEDYMCQQIKLIIENISEELYIYKERYVELMNDLTEQERAFNDEQDSYDIYIRQRGLKESLNHFIKQLGDNKLKQSDHNEEIKGINKEINKLPSKKKVEEKYIDYVRLNIIKLGAWNSAYENNIKLLKPIKAQGTLENKIILAQFVGLFQTMEYFKCESIRLPFVVDSPRAKEASMTSSKDILSMVFTVNMLPQVILATMDYSDFEEQVGQDANIITLTEKNKLLNSEDYERHKNYINDLCDLLQNV